MPMPSPFQKRGQGAPMEENPKSKMLDEMEMMSGPSEESDDMPSMDDIEDMTSTSTAAGAMDLSAIPDEVLQAELAKRKGGAAGGGAGAGPVVPPTEVTSAAP